MRIFVLSLLCVVFISSVYAQGIAFRSGSFEEVRARAKQSGQLIFIDVYTDWCGPCKKMAAEVFPDSIVGNYFNQQFVNWKFDAEKGEGIALAKKYEVTAFPTLLWIDGEGQLIYKALGYKTSEKLVEQGDNALKELNNPNGLRFLKASFEENKADTQYLRQLIDNLHTQRSSYAAALKQYKEVISEQPLFTASNINLLLTYDREMDLDDPFFQKIENNIALYLKQENEAMVNQLYAYRDKVIQNTLRKAMGEGNVQKLDKFLAFYTPKADRMFDEPKDYQLEFYLKTKNWPAFKTACEQFFDSLYRVVTVSHIRKLDKEYHQSMVEKSKINGHKLHPKALERALESAKTGYSSAVGKRVIQFAVPYATQFKDKESLLRAEQWLAKLLEFQPENVDFLLGYASVLYLSDQQGKAEDYLQKAETLAGSAPNALESVKRKIESIRSGK